MKEFKDLTPAEVSKLVGTVTISFRVKPETKLKFQLAAKKYKISFAKFCESVMENVFIEKAENTKFEEKEKTETKKIRNSGKKPEYYYFLKKSELIAYLRKNKISNDRICSYPIEMEKDHVIKRHGFIYTIKRTSYTDYELRKEKQDYKVKE